MASAPALGRRWWAARGEGSFADGEPIRVSRVRSLEEATVSNNGILHEDVLAGLARER